MYTCLGDAAAPGVCWPASDTGGGDKPVCGCSSGGASGAMGSGLFALALAFGFRKRRR
jgi:MYXO-CTERM domain-containing protein